MWTFRYCVVAVPADLKYPVVFRRTRSCGAWVAIYMRGRRGLVDVDSSTAAWRGVAQLSGETWGGGGRGQHKAPQKLGQWCEVPCHCLLDSVSPHIPYILTISSFKTSRLDSVPLPQGFKTVNYNSLNKCKSCCTKSYLHTLAVRDIWQCWSWRVKC